MSNAELVALADEAREKAYAPYSGFAVGAAVITSDSSVFTGCNVENASYGLSMCAERVAIFSAVAAEHRDIVALAVVTEAEQPLAPCGACRQVLEEFAPNARVIAASVNGTMKSWNLGVLLPEQSFE